MADGLSARVPPADLDAEGAVICAALLSGSVLDELSGVLALSDFYADANRTIYEAALAVHATGQPVDIRTVAARLRDTGQLARIGGTPYLGQLADATPAIAHVEAHARIVADKARQRRLIGICQRYAVEGYGDVQSVDDWAQRLEHEVFEAAQRSAETDPIEPLATLVPSTVGAIKERQEAGGRAPGLDTGWRDLTEKIGGWEDSVVYVIAGRPGMGKSACMLGACLNVASRDELAIFFSAEMPKEQLAARALAVEANLNIMSMRSGKMSNEEFKSLTRAAQRIAGWPLWIDYKAGPTIGNIRTSIRKACAKAKRKPRLVAIDYLQILKGFRQKGENREAEVSGLMRETVSIAAEFNCPVILGSQINRGVESRNVQNKRPSLSDLRESGAIEQDAYGVMMLYRDEYYNKESADKGVLEVDVAKNRNGGPGLVRLHFTADSTRISNLAGEYDHLGNFADNSETKYP
jgi:replicative DNA helicase